MIHHSPTSSLTHDPRDPPRLATLMVSDATVAVAMPISDSGSTTSCRIPRSFMTSRSDIPMTWPHGPWHPPFSWDFMTFMGMVKWIYEICWQNGSGSLMLIWWGSWNKHGHDVDYFGLFWCFMGLVWLGISWGISGRKFCVIQRSTSQLRVSWSPHKFSRMLKIDNNSLTLRFICCKL